MMSPNWPGWMADGDHRALHQGPEAHATDIGGALAEAPGHPRPEGYGHHRNDEHDAQHHRSEGDGLAKDVGRGEQVALRHPVGEKEGQHEGHEIKGDPVEHVQRHGVAERHVAPGGARHLA